VPEVWVNNRSDTIVFLMGGEILSGARQDRIVRRDVLVGPRRQRLAVPVYCVEEGRWHYTSHSFGSERNLGTYKLRAKAQVGGPAGQSGVWAEVAEANDEAGVSSSTGAYQDAYRDGRVSRRVEELERELADLTRRHPQAVGAIVGLGGSIVSLDLFAGVDNRARETPDLGSAYAFQNEQWDANALVLDGALLHLAAFPREPEEAGGGEEPLDGTHRQRQYGE